MSSALCSQQPLAAVDAAAAKAEDNASTEDYQETCRKYEEVLETLPKESGWITKWVVNYQGAWLTPSILKGVMLVQAHFQARPTDVILASLPKSGTTWLKALAFTVVNRRNFDFDSHPLLTRGPHDCVPSLEALFLQNTNPCPYEDVPVSEHRLFATHIPYNLLPKSAKSSGCRIVYVVRNPKDVFVSGWYHMKKVRPAGRAPLLMEEGFDMFCKGVYQFGPYWDHMLGYWKARDESLENVMILTYEDMKKEPADCVRKLAAFMARPFSAEEEREGVVEETVRLCSFENLSNLEVNKSGVQVFTPNISIENHVFFRKGGVGDWENHLTAEMVARLNRISEEKFDGTGLMAYVS